MVARLSWASPTPCTAPGPVAAPPLPLNGLSGSTKPPVQHLALLPHLHCPFMTSLDPPNPVPSCWHVPIDWSPSLGTVFLVAKLRSLRCPSCSSIIPAPLPTCLCAPPTRLQVLAPLTSPTCLAWWSCLPASPTLDAALRCPLTCAVTRLPPFPIPEAASQCISVLLNSFLVV